MGVVIMNKKELCLGHVFKHTIKECFLFIEYIEIYKEHNHYHVRHFNRVKGSSSLDKLNWETFDKFSDAKKYYNSLKKY